MSASPEARVSSRERNGRAAPSAQEAAPPLPRTAEVTAALARLEADGWIERRGAAWRTSRSFQRAMARAAAALYRTGDPGDDLRVPIALALLETYQGKVDDEVLAELVEAMLPIEATSLGLVQR